MGAHGSKEEEDKHIPAEAKEIVLPQVERYFSVKNCRGMRKIVKFHLRLPLRITSATISFLMRKSKP